MEPIRHYALERLEASGEATKYRARHAAASRYFAQIGEAAPVGPTEISSRNQLKAKHDDLRIALRWAVTNQESAAALRCTSALFHFWELRGHFQEAVRPCNRRWRPATMARDSTRSGAQRADGPLLSRRSHRQCPSRSPVSRQAPLESAIRRRTETYSALRPGRWIRRISSPCARASGPDLEAEWTAGNAAMSTRRSSAHARDTRRLEQRLSAPLPVLSPEFPVLPGHPLVQLPVCDRDRELLGSAKEIRNELENPRSRWGARLMASIIMASAVVGTAVLAAQAQPAQESFAITVPRVPDNITVPAGNKVFLVGHAIGTQNTSACHLAKTSNLRSSRRRPPFSGDGRQLITHDFSPNTFEGGTIRATWQDSRDTSAVWAQATNSSSDPNFVAPVRCLGPASEG